MAKKKKRSKFDLNLNHQEKLLIKLKQVKTIDEKEAGSIKSLIMWYLRNHYWTEPQQRFVESIIAGYAMDHRVTRDSRYYLYAISDGQNVKLGISSNIERRIKALQTSSATELSLKWKQYVGETRGIAMAAEKRLHKYCSDFRLAGEWFKPECLKLVFKFE